MPHDGVRERHGEGAGDSCVAVLCGFGSLAFFTYGVMRVYANTAAFLAASAALFILAITMGVFAYTNERATSRELSVRD